VSGISSISAASVVSTLQWSPHVDIDGVERQLAELITACLTQPQSSSLSSSSETGSSPAARHRLSLPLAPVVRSAVDTCARHVSQAVCHVLEEWSPGLARQLQLNPDHSIHSHTRQHSSESLGLTELLSQLELSSGTILPDKQHAAILPGVLLGLDCHRSAVTVKLSHSRSSNAQLHPSTSDESQVTPDKKTRRRKPAKEVRWSESPKSAARHGSVQAAQEPIRPGPADDAGAGGVDDTVTVDHHRDDEDEMIVNNDAPHVASSSSSSSSSSAVTVTLRAHLPVLQLLISVRSLLWNLYQLDWIEGNLGSANRGIASSADGYGTAIKFSSLLDSNDHAEQSPATDSSKLVEPSVDTKRFQLSWSQLLRLMLHGPFDPISSQSNATLGSMSTTESSDGVADSTSIQQRKDGQQTSLQAVFDKPHGGVVGDDDDDNLDSQSVAKSTMIGTDSDGALGAGDRDGDVDHEMEGDLDVDRIATDDGHDVALSRGEEGRAAARMQLDVAVSVDGTSDVTSEYAAEFTGGAGTGVLLLSPSGHADDSAGAPDASVGGSAHAGTAPSAIQRLRQPARGHFTLHSALHGHVTV